MAMRVVSPYRTQAPESGAHRKLGAFDWVAAARMLRASVRHACGCETVLLTDQATNVAELPAFRYVSTEPHLMIWILEVSLAYLKSPAFDCDTVFLSPDTLVTSSLRQYFEADLTILIRTHKKYRTKPILNAAQWWPVASKEKLIAFYERVLSEARGLVPELIKWGADTYALQQILEPLVLGKQERGDLTVSFREAQTVLLSISKSTVALLTARRAIPRPPAGVPIVDFKGAARKHVMAAYFQASKAILCG